MAGAPRWRGVMALGLVVTLFLPFPGPAAAYDGSVWVNHTSFDVACIGWDDPFPHKMVAAAKAAYDRLGYSTLQTFGKSFTKTAFLARDASDWGTYVHSHGDFYYNPDGRRYSGFREDRGFCAGAAIVYSKEVAAARKAHASNLVVMSTCHLGESNATMPGAFGIAMQHAYWAGPSFYLGYIGGAFDSDEWIVEQALWDGLVRGRTLGAAFDVAMTSAFNHADFDAQWWGSYAFVGTAGPYTSCRYCQ